MGDSKINLIWYFEKHYWQDNESATFTQENNNYSTFLKRKIKNSIYGTSLELLLIEYHVSTRKNFIDFDQAMRIRKKISNYSSKEKAISVRIPIILNDYIKLSETERKQNSQMMQFTL
jgi:hypothetical protein